MASARAGRAIVLAFVVVLAVAGAVAVLYKVRESSLPPTAMRFERAEAPANTTVHGLDAKVVHDAFFLEDHLEQAVLTGTSSEEVRLRVENLQETLQALTHSAGPEWWVAWHGATVRIVRT